MVAAPRERVWIAEKAVYYRDFRLAFHADRTLAVIRQWVVGLLVIFRAPRDLAY